MFALSPVLLIEQNPALKKMVLRGGSVSAVLLVLLLLVTNSALQVL